MSTILVVHHSPSPRTQLLLEAIVGGLGHPSLEGIDIDVALALNASSSQVLDAAGYVFSTPANFGYMSGALKHFFDSTFYSCYGALTHRPYAVCVHGDNDTAGAVDSIERIAVGWNLEKVTAAVSVIGEPETVDLDAVAEAAAIVGAHASESS